MTTPEKIAEELAEKCALKIIDWDSSDPKSMGMVEYTTKQILTTLNLKELVEAQGMLEWGQNNLHKLWLILDSIPQPSGNLRQAIKQAMAAQ